MEERGLSTEADFFFRNRKLIPLIDKNGDGKISVGELAAWTDRSMKRFYKQEAETRLKALDTNKDGKVSWEEYVKGAENRGGEELLLLIVAGV